MVDPPRGDDAGRPSARRGSVIEPLPMPNRPVLSPEKVSPEADAVVASFHRDLVDEVAAAVARGMPSWHKR